MSFLVDSFRKATEKMKDYRMKVETETPVAYPTGFLTFDFRNGTTAISLLPDGSHRQYYSIGLADGSIVMVIGRSACGKTTWAIQAAGNIVRNFENSAIYYEDIEGGISNSRLYKLAGMSPEVAKSKFIHRNTGITCENFYARIKMIHDIKLNNRDEFQYDTGIYNELGERVYKLQPTIVILDSLALLMPETLSEEDELSGQMSTTATAKMNAKIFRTIIPMLKAANIILIVINHITQAIAINPMQRKKAQVSYLKMDESLPGGNTPIYLANNIIRFDDGSKLKESEVFGFDGNITEVTLVKSRTNKAGQSVPMVFDQSNGFDADLSMFIFLKQRGRVNGAGAYLYLDDRSDKKFSQKGFKEKLASDPEFKQIFNVIALDEMKSMLSETYEYHEEDDEQQVTSCTDDILSMIQDVA